jgi:glycosyltransferase involved in cell wall biosynthesis
MDLGVYDFVNFLGVISEEEKFYLLQKSDAYLQLSTREGFGVAAAEALLCGVPVIHSNRGGLNDVIGDKGIILELDSLEHFDGEDISLLLNKVRKFHLNNDILKNLRLMYSLESRSRYFSKELDV